MTKPYIDDNRFRYVVSKLATYQKRDFWEFNKRYMRVLPRERALPACTAMDAALVATIKYVRARNAGRPEDQDTEDMLSKLWLEASQKVALVDPNLAEALHFKGMGWLDGGIWDIADGRGMKISVNDMQLARQKLGHILHAEGRRGESMNWERIAIFSFGVIFVTLLVAIALFLPEPTNFQYTVLRIVLALAAAGVAALIPGFIEVKYRQAVRAGGAIAVFVVVYFFSPASLVSNRDQNLGSGPIDLLEGTVVE